MSEYYGAEGIARVYYDYDERKFAVLYKDRIDWFKTEENAEIFAEDQVLKVVDSGKLVLVPRNVKQT